MTALEMPSKLAWSVPTPASLLVANFSQEGHGRVEFGTEPENRVRSARGA